MKTAVSVRFAFSVLLVCGIAHAAHAQQWIAPTLRTFYNDFESKDHGSIVIKRGVATASAQKPAGQ